MSCRDWLKVIVLILLPINAWFWVFYYLHRERSKAWREKEIQAFCETAVVVRHFRQKFGIKEGERLRYPFPYPVHLIGKQPPVGKGYPVLFINISWIASLEVWQQVIQEALNAFPDLYVVLLYSKPKRLLEGWQPIIEIVKAFNSPRLSVIASEDDGTNWMQNFFGTELNGLLLLLCDGKGIVRHIEPYPKLKFSPYWHEEVADWRPKLHQAVKKVLDKFFRQPKGRTIAPSSGGVR